MELKLDSNTDISVLHRHNEVVLDIEDSYGRLATYLLRAYNENEILAEHEEVIKFFENHQDELHDYLQKSGYIYNKA